MFLRKNVIYAIVLMGLLGIAFKKQSATDIDKAMALSKDYMAKSRSIQITL
jgi:hypothetical protein